MIARCPNCSATISNRSIRCPDCHGPLRQPGRDASRVVFLWSFAAFNALMIAWLSFYLLTGRLTVRIPRIEGDMAGAPLGGGAGLGFLLLLWFLGILILGICAAFNRAHRSGHETVQRRMIR